MCQTTYQRQIMCTQTHERMRKDENLDPFPSQSHDITLPYTKFLSSIIKRFTDTHTHENHLANPK